MDLPEILAALTLSIAPPAATDGLLRWDAPAACPSRDALAGTVAADLGRSLTPADAEAVTARATARRRDDRRWELALTIEPQDAPAVTRTVVADSCELLVDAAALMIAVAIDPDLFAGPVVTAEPTSRDPGDIPLEVPVLREVRDGPPPRSPPRSPAPSIPPPSSLRMAVSLAAGLDVGALPRPTAGFLLRLGLLARRVRAEVGAGHWLEQPVRVAGTGGGGDLRLTAAQLGVCPRFALRKVELPLCAGLELGAMRGEGVGVVTPTVDRVFWLAVLADARVQWVPVPRLALGLQLGVAVPLLAARFRLRGQDADVHRAAPVAFRGLFALELRFF
ncbi:hypothetical protein [Nannocystis sp. SCPEA4]|uniref:hypothetical protein n=1 Tax=Nannocystis sp. SCPEA4 TaxID=2996787 RepID=UPI002270F137|nr:hypothetical protein [Nannocystis sp. SCPEA4]MCY1061452.1 hypothetical protein [Nannocystis sp. SCPEA4]